jgi:Kef-type K+ transport system membrane component KefB/nucleotide-binding universal stress UspA family protein
VTSGSAEVVLVAQVALLLLVGRGLGEITQRFGQPAVIGQLLAGLILGPSLFGWVWPEAHHLIFPESPAQKNLIVGISDMGVLMLLLLTGMETDLKLVRKVGTPAIAIAAAGVAVPFACGFTLGEFLPNSILPASHDRLVAALFLGTALSISSIKIVAMVVREMNFMRRNLGQIIVASAIIEDTAGWIIISLTLGIAGAGGIAFGPLARTLISTALFLGFSYTIGRRLVFWLIRWVNDTFASEYAVVTAILIVMCAMALITQGIGVNMVLGAFVAGVLVGESPILSQHIEDELRGFITAFMMPIFFGLSGLSADLTILKDPTFALLTAGLVVLASVGKFGGAFGGGLVSRLSLRESLALGCAMNARGSTEVIVATIGLGMGALTQNLYTMIVTMAVLTTVAMPPMLRGALRRLPMAESERKRLENEELDAKGFVSQFERILIAADESPNGKFASRLAGFIAGQRGIPITVVQEREKASVERNGPTDLTPKDVATQSAKEGHRVASDRKDVDSPGSVAVSTRQGKKVHEAVAAEAGKGYDVLFIGVETMSNRDGMFSADVDRVAGGFEGPIALAIAGSDTEKLETAGFNILVPVSGTEASRRGAEMAFALASAGGSTVTIVNAVRQTESNSTKSQRAQRKTQKAVIDDIVALAKRYNCKEIRTAAHRGLAPDAAILKEVERADTDLIIIGANRRVGEALYLGETVQSVVRQWKGGMLLVAA